MKSPGLKEWRFARVVECRQQDADDCGQDARAPHNPPDFLDALLVSWCLPPPPLGLSMRRVDGSLQFSVDFVVEAEDFAGAGEGD